MLTIPNSWDEFRALDDAQVKALLEQEILQRENSPSQDDTQDRMRTFAQKVGLQNPNLLYRMAYRLGVLKKSEEAIKRTEQLRQYRQNRRAREKENLTEGADTASAATPHPSSVDARLDMLEGQIKDIQEQLKLLRRAIVLS